jgi:hypothetical protein
MPGGVLYGPVSPVSPVSRENTDTKQGPSPRSWRRMLFYVFVVIGMLCGVACLVSVGLWGSTWGCNESEEPQQTPPREAYLRLLECRCSAYYPMFLGIVGTSLTAAAACTIFFRCLDPTSEDHYHRMGILTLNIVLTVTSCVFLTSLLLTLAFWGESQSTCGPELYNTGFLVLFMGISTILALCCGTPIIMSKQA